MTGPYPKRFKFGGAGGVGGMLVPTDAGDICVPIVGVATLAVEPGNVAALVFGDGVMNTILALGWELDGGEQVVDDDSVAIVGGDSGFGEGDSSSDIVAETGAVVTPVVLDVAEDGIFCAFDSEEEGTGELVFVKLEPDSMTPTSFALSLVL